MSSFIHEQEVLRTNDNVNVMKADHGSEAVRFQSTIVEQIWDIEANKSLLSLLHDVIVPFQVPGVGSTHGMLDEHHAHAELQA